MRAITLNDKRQIVIELSWLLDAMSDDQKRELVDSLACEGAIIEDVAAQLLDGWTERGSHGSLSIGADSEPTTPLSKARRTLASRCGEVAEREIEDLKRALVWAKCTEQYYSDAYFKLYHAWPRERLYQMPGVGSISHANTTAYEVVKKGTQ